MQHCSFVVHAPAIGSHIGGGAQLPFVHTLLQQSVPVVHAPPVGVHGVVHRCVPGSQIPWQQSASTAHVAFWALHTSSPKSQRGGSCSSSHTPEQHPICEPELQVSPIPRQVVFAGSSWHSPPVQMLEQHSAGELQSSDWTWQIAPPHVPLLQFRSQQSVALVHDAPLPRQKLVH